MSNELITANNEGLADALGLNGFGNTPTMLNPASLIYNSSYFPITNMLMMLTNAYKTYGWIKVAVSQPIDDAFRNGVDLESSTLEEEELNQLLQKMEDEEDWVKIKDTLRWGRLYGGGVLVVNCEQKADRPINYKGLKDNKLEFYATDRWQCSAIDTSVSPKDSDFIMNEVIIDKSRVFAYLGDSAPFLIRTRISNWGMSILEQTLPEIVRYLKSLNVSLELLDEAKIDILQIDSLAEILMLPQGADQIRKRIEIAAQNKNYKNMLAIDSKDSYSQKQISFSGFPEMVDQIMSLIAGTLRMPKSKLFGIGSTGFSSGEDNLENYNSMIESEIRIQATKLIKWVVDLRCWQLFGRTLPDLKIKWKSLRVLDAKTEQDINTSKINNWLALWDRQIISSQELMELAKREQIILMDTEALQGKKNDVTPNYQNLEDMSFENLKGNNTEE